MQWIIAFIAAIVAAAAEQSVMGWTIMGFWAGYILSVNNRVSRLEQHLHQLQTEWTLLKTQDSSVETALSPSLTAKTNPPSESTEPLAENSIKIIELASHSPPPLVSPAQRKPPKPIETPRVSDEPPAVKKLIEIIALASPPVPPVPFPEPPEQSEPEENHWLLDEPPPSEPSDFDKTVLFIWRWFTDGNTFVRLGIVILFVGVSFLLNLAIDEGFIPIGLRLSAVALAALGLLSVGWRLKERHGGYGLLVQGGGVGLLYLTIFASYSLYHLLPAGLAFTLLVAIVGLSATLAVLENAVSLALFGTIGGFLAPILTSSGDNNYIGLFSFYAVLNAGVFAIAWFKAWRVLNLIGFGFTFSIGALWGASSYTADLFPSVEFFLLLFFLFYVGIGMLYATRRVPDFKDYIDGTLIFGTPILAFGLQAALVKNDPYGIALSAFVLGGFYLALAGWVWRHLGATLKFLSEAFLSVSVIFTTLAIPFAVDGMTTAATWAVEGTGVLWVSVRQQQIVRRIFALGLQLFAGLALFAHLDNHHGTVFFNSVFISVLIIVGCAGLSSCFLSKKFPGRRSFERTLSPWLLAYSLLWLFLGYDAQIEGHKLEPLTQNALMLGLTIVCTLVLTQLGLRLAWKAAENAALAMLVPLLLGGIVTLGIESHPSAGYGVLLWSLAITSYFYALKKAKATAFTAYLHIAIGLFLSLLLFWEGFWQLLFFTTLLSVLFNRLTYALHWIQLRILAFGLLPVMLFLSFCNLFTHDSPFTLPDTTSGLKWPFEAGYVLWPLAFATLYWQFYDSDKREAAPFYLPVFHALSLLLIVVLVTWQIDWHISETFSHTGWHDVLQLPMTLAALGLIMQARFWPFTRHRDAYLDNAAKPLGGWLICWSLMEWFNAAPATPLPWIPFLNPAELMQIIVLMTLLRFTFSLPNNRLTDGQKQNRYRILAVFTFIWLNGVLLRAIHHWGGFAWSADLLDLPVTQTSLSIFWTVSGLFLTFLATRRQKRTLWIIGASLLAVVVIKLLSLDLYQHDSITRIISFITVGMLLMLIGYFAPLPPKQQDNENAP